ncbi:MAG: hypothetical protein HYV28_07425 [Ignavibacteriales bacterium]|nr:hypothetical protein [Ignavibacteriales bacterium]
MKKVLMKNTLQIVLLLVFCVIGKLAAQPVYEKTNSAPGEFSRMGFLPRGIAMGNATSAVIEGQLSSFYNPAVAVFQNKNSAQAAFSVLSLDRSLNYLSFTRRFDFYSSRDTGANRTPRSSAGFSAGVIASGVSDIDGRDNQGFKTEALSTSQNLYFFSFANRFSKKVAIGVTVKIYYYKLYKDVTSTGTGFDFGAIYKATDNLAFAATFMDINAKYKWDTSPIYGTDGTATTADFPLTIKLGSSYIFRFDDNSSLLTALELESNNLGRRLIRAGAEYQFMPELTLRAGLDNFVMGNADELLQPSGGFALRNPMFGVDAGIDYTFAFEQYSQSLRHTIGLSVVF